MTVKVEEYNNEPRSAGVWRREDFGVIYILGLGYIKIRS